MKIPIWHFNWASFHLYQSINQVASYSCFLFNREQLLRLQSNDKDFVKNYWRSIAYSPSSDLEKDKQAFYIKMSEQGWRTELCGWNDSSQSCSNKALVPLFCILFATSTAFISHTNLHHSNSHQRPESLILTPGLSLN